ncbi:hypothetical protein TNCV_522231 [Trichonephila clavipes]|nr:hypothetical protein TNCV_522231 [Trichonephila clavipes]
MFTNDHEEYRTLVHFLESDKDFELYVINRKIVKPIKAVIKDLPSSSKIEDITNDLADEGYVIESCTQLISRRTKKALPYFLVILPRNANNRKIFDLAHLSYLQVKVEDEPSLAQPASDKFNLLELIPTYEGSESLGIRRFLSKINDVAELGKWSNAEKVTIFKLKLSGIAEEFFLSDPSNSQLTNFDDIAQVLSSRFERTVPLSTRLQLFSSCLQGVSESVQEFSARIKKLGTQIFQSGNSVQTTAARNANDQLLQSRFINGLRNDIRGFVLARDPNTLEESINAALIEEQNLKLNEIVINEHSGLSAQAK